MLAVQGADSILSLLEQFCHLKASFWGHRTSQHLVLVQGRGAEIFVFTQSIGIVK